MTEGLTLRPAATADLAAVLALNEANVPGVGPTSLERLTWFLEQAALFTVACDRAGGVAGFVICLSEGSSYDSPNYGWFAARRERFFYVDRIAVDGSRRRLGAGRALYDHVVTAARAGGWPTVVAEVNVEPRNDVSLAFHDRYGFRILAEVADPRYEHQVVAMVELPLTTDT